MIGNSVFGRPHADLHHTMGMFVNKLAIRAFPEKEKSFTKFIREVKQHSIEAFDNQEVQFEEIVDKLKAEGLIDGEAIELVLDGANSTTKADLMKEFKSNGLPVYITEFSVNMRNVSGSPEEKLRKQAEIYKAAMEACVESGVCLVFVDFQLGDKFSTWENNKSLPKFSKDANPTPFDDNLKPKSAFFAQKQAFITSSSP